MHTICIACVNTQIFNWNTSKPFSVWKVLNVFTYVALASLFFPQSASDRTTIWKHHEILNKDKTPSVWRQYSWTDCVCWNIQHFDLTRVTSYQITACHFHWELRARRHVLSCSTHSHTRTHVYARFFQLDSCTSNFGAELCVSGNYGGVYCDWCSLLESDNLFNCVQSYSSETTKCVFEAQNGRIVLIARTRTVWHTSGSKSLLFMRMSNNENTSEPSQPFAAISRFRKFVAIMK